MASSEHLAVALLVLPIAVVLAVLFVLLRLSGKRGFDFSARGFGVSVHLSTEAEAEKELNPDAATPKTPNPKGDYS